VNETNDAHLNRWVTEDYTGAAVLRWTPSYMTSCQQWASGIVCSRHFSTASHLHKCIRILGSRYFGLHDYLGSSTTCNIRMTGKGMSLGGHIPNGLSPGRGQLQHRRYRSQIQRSRVGGSFSDVVSSFTYAPTGQTITTVFGSGACNNAPHILKCASYRLTPLKTLPRTIQNVQISHTPMTRLAQYPPDIQLTPYRVRARSPLPSRMTPLKSPLYRVDPRGFPSTAHNNRYSITTCSARIFGNWAVATGGDQVPTLRWDG